MCVHVFFGGLKRVGKEMKRIVNHKRIIIGTAGKFALYGNVMCNNELFLCENADNTVVIGWLVGWLVGAVGFLVGG